MTYFEDFLKRPIVNDIAGSIDMPLAPDTNKNNFAVTNNVIYGLKPTVQSGCYLSPDAAEKYTNILQGEGMKYVIADHPIDAKNIK